MAWTEPEKTSAVAEGVSRLIVRSRDTAIAQRTRKIREEAEALAARGATGASVRKSEAASADALVDFARVATADILSFMGSVYGSVPGAAAPWIRQQLAPVIEQLANALVRENEATRTRHRIATRGADEAVMRAKHDALRDLEIALSPLVAREELGRLTPPDRQPDPRGMSFDVFVSHASEDKDDVAVPLAKALEQRGYRVWLDKFELKVGDRLLDKIDDGLASSRVGVVILSPRFLKKNWTRRELAGLAAREDAEAHPMILPVRHGISQSELAAASPLLASILGVDWSEGVDSVVEALVKAIGPPAHTAETVT